MSDIIARLKADGMDAVDLSENEFAKSHVRHLVGGRGEVEHERLFRFGKLVITRPPLLAVTLA